MYVLRHRRCRRRRRRHCHRIHCRHFVSSSSFKVTIRNCRRLENNTIPFYKNPHENSQDYSFKKPLPVKIDYEEKCGCQDKAKNLAEEMEKVKGVAGSSTTAFATTTATTAQQVKSPCAESKKIQTNSNESSDKKNEKVLESNRKKSSSSSPTSTSASTCDKFLKIEFVQSDKKMCEKTEPKKGSIVCADCDKCEMQIKANGEGIILKCHMCRQVPSEEILFPTGNGHKVVTFP